MQRRFSRFAILVSVTLLALLVISVVQSLRLRQLEGHLAEALVKSHRLETRLGIVSAGDPTQVQVHSVLQRDQHHWKWRVRMPKNTQFRLAFRMGKVTEDQFKVLDGQIPYALKPEEDEIVEVEMQLYRDTEGKWSRMVRVNGSRMSGRLSDEMQAWVANFPRYASESAGVDATQEFSLEKRLLLLRTCELPSLGSSNAAILPIPPFVGPAEHILLLWIEFDQVAK